MSRPAQGTAFVLVPANIEAQSPLSIVREVLSKRLVWGDVLKALVRTRFGNGVVISAMLEQLPYDENRVELDPSVRDDLGFPVPQGDLLP